MGCLFGVDFSAKSNGIRMLSPSKAVQPCDEPAVNAEITVLRRFSFNEPPAFFRFTMQA